MAPDPSVDKSHRDRVTLKRGLIVLSGSHARNVLTLTPPLTISKAQLLYRPTTILKEIALWSDSHEYRTLNTSFALENFDALALDVFHYQFELNISYRSFCRSQDKTPETVRRWQDIPAVPMQAFKSTELTTAPASRAAAMFESQSNVGSRSQPSLSQDV